MKEIVNNCVGCETCRGCTASQQEITLCDMCNDEIGRIYYYEVDGMDLCDVCIKNYLLDYLQDDLDTLKIDTVIPDDMTDSELIEFFFDELLKLHDGKEKIIY